jgi:hypothetical protein
MMARLSPIAAIALVAALVPLPAQAQFDSIFGSIFGGPPRPPAGVPGGGRQPPADAQQPASRPGVPPGVQSSPLPPPPGVAVIDQAPPGQRPLRTPQPGNTQPMPQLPPAQGAPPPGDEVVAEPPSQRIANKEALFSGLDKITGRVINFDVKIGETVQFGALQVTPRACYTRPPTETANTDAFVEVDEVTLEGEIKRVFTGWMFAASPGLHAVEHPIYDVWLTDCKGPPQTAAAAPVPDSAPAAAPQPKAPQRQQPPAQPKRPAPPPR